MLLYILAYAPLLVMALLLCFLFGFLTGIIIVIISYLIMGVIVYFIAAYFNGWRFLDSEIIKSGIFWPISLVWIVAMLERK